MSVVMSWIGGDALALCNIANGTQNAAAAMTTPAKAKAKPRLGVAKGEFSVPESFFEPLPDELLKAFGGQ